MKKNILLFFTFLIWNVLNAQAPSKFNYQGAARDKQGSVISNQNISLKISILQGSASGSIVYSENHFTKTNSLGLFALIIGSGTANTGVFSDIKWNNGDKFIQIEMDPNGGSNFSLLGINQLLSVPFALSAANGSQWENTDNGIFYNGDVGIGTDLINQNVSNNNGSLYPDYKWHGLHIKNNDNALFTLEGREFSRIHFVSNDGYENSKNYTIQVSNKYSDNNSTYLNIASMDDKFYCKDRGIVLHENGNVSIGGDTYYVTTPKSKLQITGGDVYIEDISKGVIMKSPNGNCWRMTVSDSGQPVFSSITCPN